MKDGFTRWARRRRFKARPIQSCGSSSWVWAKSSRRYNVAQKRSIEIRVGIFVVVCLALLAGLIWKLGKYEPLTKKSYEIEVVFSNVGGIGKDASVLYGGFKGGSVHDISLDQAGQLKIHVKLEIFQTVKG